MMPQVGRVVAGVGIDETPALWIEDGIQAGNEHVGWYVSDQLFVRPFQDLPRWEETLGRDTQHGAGRRHHQRGGYALVGHIPNHETQASIFQLECIVEVTSYLACGLVVGCYVVSRELGQCLGQEGLLDEACDPEFLLDALPLLRLTLLLGDIVLDTQPIQGLPFLIAHQRRLIAHPHHSAIPCDDAVLYVEGLTSLVSASLFGQHPLPVFGVHYPVPVLLVDYLRLWRVTEYGLVLRADVCHGFRIAGLEGLLHVGDGRSLFHEGAVASLGLLLLTHEPGDPHRRRRLGGKVAQELAVVCRVLLLREARPEAQEPDQLALLTSGTTSSISADFIALSAWESRSRSSTSTTPETVARYAKIRSSGAISISGVSIAVVDFLVASLSRCGAFSHSDTRVGCIVSLITSMSSLLRASRSVSVRSLAEKASRVFLASYFLR